MSSFERRLLGWPIGSDRGSAADEGHSLMLLDGIWTGGFPGVYDLSETIVVTQGAGAIVPLTSTVEKTVHVLRDVNAAYTYVELSLIEIWFVLDAGTAGDAGDPVTITFDAFAPVDDIPLTGRHAGTGYVLLDGEHIPVHALWDAPGVIVLERLDGPTNLIGIDPNAGLAEGDVISLHLRRRVVTVIGS